MGWPSKDDLMQRVRELPYHRVVELLIKFRYPDAVRVVFEPEAEDRVVFYTVAGGRIVVVNPAYSLSAAFVVAEHMANIAGGRHRGVSLEIMPEAEASDHGGKFLAILGRLEQGDKWDGLLPIMVVDDNPVRAIAVACCMFAIAVEEERESGK